MASKDLKLPLSVVGKIDIGRLLREAEELDNFLEQSHLRKPGKAHKLPKTSRMLDEVLESNQLNALHKTDRKQLITFLKDVRNHSPVIHISFSSDPSPLFTQKLITWLRQNIHPKLLLQIGLQPNIGAGCVVRTTNKYFDFSLRTRMQEKGNILSGLLKEEKA